MALLCVNNLLNFQLYNFCQRCSLEQIVKKYNRSIFCWNCVRIIQKDWEGDSEVIAFTSKAWKRWIPLWNPQNCGSWTCCHTVLGSLPRDGGTFKFLPPRHTPCIHSEGAIVIEQLHRLSVSIFGIKGEIFWVLRSRIYDQEQGWVREKTVHKHSQHKHFPWHDWSHLRETWGFHIKEATGSPSGPLKNCSDGNAVWAWYTYLKHN